MRSVFYVALLVPTCPTFVSQRAARHDPSKKRASEPRAATGWISWTGGSGSVIEDESLVVREIPEIFRNEAKKEETATRALTMLIFLFLGGNIKLK